MDPLSIVLNDLRLESTLYCALRVTAPWAVAYPGGRQAGFHVVTGGGLELVIEGRAPLVLETGDMVVLPRGTAHVLRAVGAGAARQQGHSRNAADVVARSIVELVTLGADGVSSGSVAYGGGGALTEQLSGAIRLPGARRSSVVVGVARRDSHPRRAGARGAVDGVDRGGDGV